MLSYQAIQNEILVLLTPIIKAYNSSQSAVSTPNIYIQQLDIAKNSKMGGKAYIYYHILNIAQNPEMGKNAIDTIIAKYCPRDYAKFPTDISKFLFTGLTADNFFIIELLEIPQLRPSLIKFLIKGMDQPEAKTLLIHVLANMEWGKLAADNTEYQYLIGIKEYLRKHLIEISKSEQTNDRDEILTILKSIICIPAAKKNNLLQAIFWQERGLFKPSLGTGQLRELYDEVKRRNPNTPKAAFELKQESFRLLNKRFNNNRFVTLKNQLLQTEISNFLNNLLTSLNSGLISKNEIIDFFHAKQSSKPNYNFGHCIAQSGNNEQNRKWLTVLKEHFIENYPIEILELFNSKDDYECNLSQFIFDKQDEATSGIFLDILATLSKKEPTRVLEILTGQNSNDGNMLMILAGRSAELTKKCLGLLKNIAKDEPLKLVNLLNCAENNNLTFPIFVGAKGDKEAIRGLLDLLSCLSENNPRQVFDILKHCNIKSANLGIYIAYMSQENVPEYLNLLRKLQKKGIAPQAIKQIIEAECDSGHLNKDKPEINSLPRIISLHSQNVFNDYQDLLKPIEQWEKDIVSKNKNENEREINDKIALLNKAYSDLISKKPTQTLEMAAINESFEVIKALLHDYNFMQRLLENGNEIQAPDASAIEDLRQRGKVFEFLKKASKLIDEIDIHLQTKIKQKQHISEQSQANITTDTRSSVSEDPFEKEPETQIMVSPAGGNREETLLLSDTGEQQADISETESKIIPDRVTSMKESLSSSKSEEDQSNFFSNQFEDGDHAFFANVSSDIKSESNLAAEEEFETPSSVKFENPTVEVLPVTPVVENNVSPRSLEIKRALVESYQPLKESVTEDSDNATKQEKLAV